MTTKEVANICGVTDRTVSGNALKAGVVLEHGKTHDWSAAGISSECFG